MSSGRRELSLLLLVLACGCSTSDGSPPSASFSCRSVSVGVTTCDRYEASGFDDPAALAPHRSACNASNGSTLVAGCPTTGNLGGCESAIPSPSDGGASITVTSYWYAIDAGLPLPVTTSAQVKALCAGQDASFVAP